MERTSSYNSLNGKINKVENFLIKAINGAALDAFHEAATLENPTTKEIAQLIGECLPTDQYLYEMCSSYLDNH